MNLDRENPGAAAPERPKPRHAARAIAVGLLLGVACGVFFGEYCSFLEVIGKTYVGLLQMTVLPYLTISLVAQMGRLHASQVGRLGLATFAVLLVLGLTAAMLIVAVSPVLPPIEGASFFSQTTEPAGRDLGLLSSIFSANVFRWLSDGFVPGIVFFCLLFGLALILTPGKERLLDALDLVAASLSRINLWLVRLAPFGLFTLAAEAAGTMQLDELSRLQAYLMMLALACAAAAFIILPLLLSSLTCIGYRELLNAAMEPLLTAVATGRLFVALPQIAQQCELLLSRHVQPDDERGSGAIAQAVVPLAYPLPHIGKILSFTFVTFAAWYVGRGLSLGETAGMAVTGAASSFASPLISMPYLLDLFRLPQDLMQLFILPGFITMRMGDVVGVLHLMVVALMVDQLLRGRIQVRWRRLTAAAVVLVICLTGLVAAGRWYLTSTTLSYDLDQHFLSLELPAPHDDVVVFRTRADVPRRARRQASALDLIKAGGALRVGYHADHLPYSFFNRQQHLVGMDVELMHRLASRLQVRLEFVPYSYGSVEKQMESGEIDLAVGGLIATPQRLAVFGFCQPYQTATIAVLVRDHRREEFEAWNNAQSTGKIRLAIAQRDLLAPAQRLLPQHEIVSIDSISSFFSERREDLDGLIIAAEEGAVWNVLYPEYDVVVPEPVTRRPVSIATLSHDVRWQRFLDRWLDIERLDGTLDRLDDYWVKGGGAEERPPRWCVARNLLHWLP